MFGKKKVQEATPEAQPKKRKFRWWHALIILCVIGFISSATKEEEPAPAPVADNEIVETLEPEEPTAPEEEAQLAEEEEPTEEEPASVEVIASLIEMTAKQYYDNCNVTYDDESITLNLWVDGLADAAAAVALLGEGADNPNWVNMKNQFIKLSQSMQNLGSQLGRDDVSVIVQILNDQNRDNVLLSFYNGTVIYDCLAK